MVVWLGDLLAPVFAAIVIAFILDWLIQLATRGLLSRTLSFYCVFLIFMGLLGSGVFILLPFLGQQALHFFQEMPQMLANGQARLMELPAHYPSFFSHGQIQDFLNTFQTYMTDLGKTLLSLSRSSVLFVKAIVLYLVLVPLMVFFLLKDRNMILNWMAQFLPEKRIVSKKVWQEVNVQLGNYIRGKVVECVLIAIAMSLIFAALNLNYAILLGVLVGLSVFVPYVGAVVVTFPVAIVAFLQWGWGTDFIYVMVIFGIVMALDGSILVPLLFAGVNQLHPLAIILAVIFFGGLWGFWGVFFAIPLAILVKAVIHAWPDAA